MGKSEFKQFINRHPNLASYVEDGTMTWQKFYELYDIYGENNEIWQKYITKKTPKISDFMTKLDPDTIQKNIESLEKAIDIFKELTNKATDNVENIKPIIERPIHKFFGD